MEELRLALLVLGACAIAGILAHGLWSIRKNATGKEKPSYQPRDWDLDDISESADEDDQPESLVIDADIEIDPQLEPNFSHAPMPERDESLSAIPTTQPYDDLGLGPVRVVTKKVQDDPDETNPEPKPAATQQASSAPASAVQRKENTSSRIYSSVVTQPKPEYVAAQQAIQERVATQVEWTNNDIPEPPPSLLKNDPVAENDLDLQPSPSPASTQSVEKDQSTDSVKPVEKFSLAEQARNLVKRKKADSAAKKRREPQIGGASVREDQLRIDFDDIDPVEPAPAAADNSSSSNEMPEQEVLILNVKSPEDQPIQGSALLPMLLTLGFKFGDQDIFHRHVNSNGKGPVLFSLANMFKPGVFDIDNLENFTTQGISLFMILPIEGDPHQVFNMMHNAARKIADEFSSQVVDAKRSVLTKQSLQQYVEKIREFERKRLLR